jgi:hypothetical protein
MTTFTFDGQLGAGKDGEARLDRYFERWYIVLNVPLVAERLFGIDRVFIRRDNGQLRTFEYKTDSHTTGNVFIETVSVDTNGAPGWAFKTRANAVVYYLTALGVAYAIHPDKIRAALPVWQQRYREISIPNKGYHTRGIAVPFAELERIGAQRFRIEDNAA